MLLIFIPIGVAWLGLATFVVCLCRMAALADRAPRAPRGLRRAQVIVLEPAAAGFRARHRASARAGIRAPLRGHGLATIHPIR
jgi:hypothetical protein